MKNRFTITPDAALDLARKRISLPEAHKLVAPTLLRSDILSLLYRAVREGEMDKKEADAQLDYLRGLRIRLLGDRVLQRNAWAIAAKLDWPDTNRAEYIAVTQLQADVLVTLDADFASAAAQFVTIAPMAALLADKP